LHGRGGGFRLKVIPYEADKKARKGIAAAHGGVIVHRELRSCQICGNHETAMHVDLGHGNLIYVCGPCLQKARNNFIWICLHCGKTYERPKEEVLKRLEAYGVDNACLMCSGEHLIFGIEECIECDPQGILDHVYADEMEVPVRMNYPG
jgi:hypothetical protein